MKILAHFTSFSALLALALVGSSQAQTTPTVQVKTIADLVALPIPIVNTRLTAIVSGRTTANDGDGGVFIYEVASTRAVDSGTVFGTTGRWLRQYSGPLEVSWFGQVGTADDTAVVQAAANAACQSGEPLHFKTFDQVTRAPMVYSISQINLTNAHPIKIFSEMTGNGNNASYGNGSHIQPIGHTTNSVFAVLSSTASRDGNGGVTFEGISIRDTSAALGKPGANSVLSAIYLRDGNHSYVQKCDFENINGSAILADFCIKSFISDNIILYSGAAGKSAVYFRGTDGTYYPQHITFAGNKIEACYNAPYVYVSALTTELHASGNGFEAETSDSNSCQNFYYVQGRFCNISGEHYNRNTVPQVYLETNSYSIIVSGSTSRASINSQPALTMAGNYSMVSLMEFNSGKTGSEVLIQGSENKFLDNYLLNSGGVLVDTAANGTMINGNSIVASVPTTTNAFWIDVRASDCSINQNTIVGITNGPGGIKIGNVTATRFGGNTIKNTLCGILNQSGNSVGPNNVCYQNITNFLSDPAFPPSPGIGRDNFFPDATPLQATVIVDPPSLDPGKRAVIFVALPGVALGDLVSAGLSSLFQNGVSIAATVVGNALVEVSIVNNSPATVNIATGILTVIGMKSWPDTPTTTNTVSITDVMPSGYSLTNVVNTGTGFGILNNSTSQVATLNSIGAGTNIVVTSNAGTLFINASATAGGETNTASNLGNGLGIFNSKSGVDLRLNSLTNGTYMDMSSNANMLSFDVRVAADGVSDSTKVVRSDDSRLAQGAFSLGSMITFTGSEGWTDIYSTTITNGATEILARVVAYNATLDSSAYWNGEFLVGYDGSTMHYRADTGAASSIDGLSSPLQFDGTQPSQAGATSLRLANTGTTFKIQAQGTTIGACKVRVITGLYVTAF